MTRPSCADASGALAGMNDGRTVCIAAANPVFSGEPRLAGPEVMQGAREALCQETDEERATGAKDHSTPTTDDLKAIDADARAERSAEEAKIAAEFHISNELADVALNRAASEWVAGRFECPKRPR
jgi:hypothetical protein